MFIFGNLFIAAGQLFSWLATIYMVVIFLSAVVSWFPIDPYHPFTRFLRQVTEPVYDRVRRYLPRPVWNNAIGADFTPAVVFVLLWFLNGALFQSVIELGYRLK